MEKSKVETPEQLSVERMPYYKIMWETSKSILPYSWVIFFNYIVTFLLFPDLTLTKTVEPINFVWSSIIFIIVYNVGDTVGKFVCDFKGSFNSYSTNYTVLARLYFFLTIPLLANHALDSDVLLVNPAFPYINQFFFAVSNGLVTNACFILAFQKVPEKYKKYAGVLCGIMLQIGIMIGTILEIPFRMLVMINTPK